MQKTSDVYETLYHYTTWSGLLGILKTQTLWATHYRFLNDYSEIALFRNKLVVFLRPYVAEQYRKLVEQSPHLEQQISEEGGMDQIVQHDTEVFVDAQYHATRDEIYILSFCGQHSNPHVNDNGLLSQWRGYGASGGFALVLNAYKLEGLLAAEYEKFEYSTMHLSDVVYSDNESRLKEELSESLSILASDVKGFFDPAKSSAEERAAAVKGYTAFVTCISRYKHCGFSEENEVRAVVLPAIVNRAYTEWAQKNSFTLKPEKERKFRHKNGQLVPYTELFGFADMKLPIERIIVGPHKEKEARAATLRVMLRNTGIEITSSDIPFAE
ncbi:MAG TPA: DUF2971 domain-containing protein [Syntrophorhabdales bacterium]|nr:DUF2971 domain-containing protein [Syntrophorhabdales bacterium]